MRKSILIAYESKEMPNLLLNSFPYDISSAEDGDENDLMEREHDELNVHVIDLGDERLTLPSELLGNDQWLQRVESLFHLSEVRTIFDEASVAESSMISDGHSMEEAAKVKDSLIETPKSKGNLLKA